MRWGALPGIGTLPTAGPTDRTVPLMMAVTGLESAPPSRAQDIDHVEPRRSRRSTHAVAVLGTVTSVRSVRPVALTMSPTACRAPL